MGGAGGTAGGPSGGAAGSASGGADIGGAGIGGAGTGGADTGGAGTGGAPCTSSPETCNGLDDDCDGLVDYDGAMSACLCQALDADARYIRCFRSKLVTETFCPDGYGLALVTSSAESNVIATLVTPNMYWVGLFQEADATTLGGGWVYADGSTSNPPWYAGAPNDDDGVEELTEDGDENCAVFLKADSSIYGLDDVRCTEDERPYLCEQLEPAP
jgi:hypothetical protein